MYCDRHPARRACEAARSKGLIDRADDLVGRLVRRIHGERGGGSVCGEPALVQRSHIGVSEQRPSRIAPHPAHGLVVIDLEVDDRGIGARTERVAGRGILQSSSSDGDHAGAARQKVADDGPLHCSELPLPT
jgi:hypothetical protein